jgi:hypothetical protein
MKTRIEEAAEKEFPMPDNKDVARYYVNDDSIKSLALYALARREGFIAGAEFMQKEVNKLKAQNKIMREALELICLENIYIGENGWRDEYILSFNQAKEALEKIGEV